MTGLIKLKQGEETNSQLVGKISKFNELGGSSAKIHAVWFTARSP
jgi:hypothetical protein